MYGRKSYMFIAVAAVRTESTQFFRSLCVSVWNWSVMKSWEMKRRRRRKQNEKKVKRKTENHSSIAIGLYLFFNRINFKFQGFFFFSFFFYLDMVLLSFSLRFIHCMRGRPELFHRSNEMCCTTATKQNKITNI